MKREMSIGKMMKVVPFIFCTKKMVEWEATAMNMSICIMVILQKMLLYKLLVSLL